MRRFRKITAVFLALIMMAALLTPTLNAVMLPENTPLAREILSEGMVLLKNDHNSLPLKDTDKIAIFGQGQRWVDSTTQGYQVGGGGSGNLAPGKTPVGPIDALLEAEKNGEITLYHPLADKYQADIAYTPDAAMYDGAAEFANKAIMFISRFSKEGADRSVGKGDWLLSDAETAMMKELSARFDDVIVLANVGGVIDTSWAVGDVEGIDIEALLMVWQGGMEGGNGIADVLLGRTNPSGKLVDTYAKDINDYPSTEGFYNTAYVNYTEDVYVGYRYFETFDPNYERVNYEFGFGLSYTQFDISDVKYSADDETISVEATVTNIGNVPGKEVLQVYFSAPQMGENGAVLSKPAKELAAFAKTNELAPGKSQKLTMSFAIKDMATFDDTGLTEYKSAYILEAGDYDIYVGNSVKDAGTRLAGTYKVDALKVSEQFSQLVAPVGLPRRLLADGSYETINGDPVVPKHNISATEPTKVEAEDFSGAHEGVSIESNSNVSGKSIGSINAAGKYLEYILNVEEAGVYDFTFRMAHGKAHTRDFMNVYIDDTLQQNVFMIFPRTGDGASLTSDYFNFGFSDTMQLILPKGEFVLKIEAKTASFPNLDYFIVEKHNQTVISADQATKIQTEFFNDSTSGTDTDPRRESFTTSQGQVQAADGKWSAYSGGNLAYMHKVGNYATYNIYVEKAGTYELSFRVANGRDQVSNFMTFAVNGVDQNINMTVPRTAETSAAKRWYSFIDSDQRFLVELPAGESTITITSKTTQFPNIDYFTFSPYVPVGKDSSTKLEAEGYVATTGTTRIEYFVDAFRQDPVISKAVTYLDKTYEASVTYTIDVLEAGDYDLTLALANGYDAKDLTLDVYLDGNKDAKQTLQFNCPRTGAADALDRFRYHNYQEVAAGKITLPAGRYRMTLDPDITAYGTAGGFANLDYILLSPANATNSIPVMRSASTTAAPKSADSVIQLQDVVDGLSTYEEFVAQMTPEELASFTVGYGAGIGSGTGQIGGSNEVSDKYGIPRADTADGPGGLRVATKSTAWGCEMLTGCTWNVELAEKFGIAVGKEAVVSGVDIWLAPGMNIHRNPMCGRNFEYYAEDPLLTGKMGAAVARGVQSEGIAVTIKHFTANNKEGNRKGSDSRVSERALREIYLRGFEIAVKEGGAWTIMSSYNYLNGIGAAENPELLTDIVRGEWGFDGFIMTDWNNQKDIVKEVNAGNNVKMPSGSGDPQDVIDAYYEGAVTRETLEKNAIDILRVLVKLPDFTAHYGSSPVHPVSSKETTKVEAEQYYQKYPLVRIEYNGEITDLGYLDQKDSAGQYASYATYELKVERAGTYAVDFCVANNADRTDTVALYVNSELQDGIVFNTPNTGGWTTFKEAYVGEVYLPAGNVTFRVQSKGSVGNLDYVKFTPVSLEEGAEIIAPESVMKNETFDVIINTTEDYGKLRMENEVGRAVGFSITEKTANEDGSFTTKVNLWLGTAGTGRTISVYADGVKLGDFTLDILAPPPTPDGIYEIEAPESAEAGQSFQVTVTTTKNLIKGSFWNETGRGIGRTIDQRIYNGEMLKTVYSLAIETPSKEARTITFRADYNGCSKWPFEKSFDIMVF